MIRHIYYVIKRTRSVNNALNALEYNDYITPGDNSYIYIYIYVCVCMCVCMCVMYIYIDSIILFLLY